MNRYEPFEPSARFRRVYQGHHHDVYCDGVYHVTTTGGTVEMAGKVRGLFKHQFSCDCARYRAGAT